MQKVTDALFSKKEATASLRQGFVTKCFLIFIVDEVKNFATNIFFWLVIKSRTGICAIGQSHTGIRASKGSVHILKSLEVLKQQKVFAVSSSTKIVKSRDKGFVLDLKLLFTIVNCFSRRFPLRFFTVNQFVSLVFLGHHILSYLFFCCMILT